MAGAKVTEPEARAAYLAMGPARSLTALHRQITKSAPDCTVAVRTIKTWSSKNNWQALAAEHDKRVTERAVARTETEQATALADAAVELGLDKRYVLQTLKTVVERSLQAEPVLDAEGNPTGEYRFDSRGATAAAVQIGKELGMFREPVAPPAATPNVNVTINNVDVRVTQVRNEINEMLAYEPPAIDAPRRN